MFSLFLSLPGSDGCGHRRLPPTLGRASGLRVSSVVCHSTGDGEAPGVSGDGAHPDSSLLASASVVSRPPSHVAGPSGCSASSSRPPAPASVSQPLPGSPQASLSCLETLRRFTRAAGFSSSVPSQASLSLTSLSGSSTVPGAALTGILSPVRRWLRLQIFFAGSAPQKIWGFLPSGATAPCCLRFFVSNSLLSLLILCFGIFLALSASGQRNASFALPLGTSPWFWGSLTPLPLNLFQWLPCVRSPRRCFFFWLWPRPSVWESYRPCHLLSPLFMVMPVFLMSLSLLPSWSRSPAPSLAPSWLSPCPTLRLVLMTTSCSALSRLSAFIWTGFLLCLLFAIVFSCLFVTPHVLSLRTRSRSSSVTWFLLLGLLGLRWVDSELMTSAVSPPLSRFTATGRSPQS